MKQMLRLMTPTKDVLNEIMILADKKRSSRWSVPVLHHFPVERPTALTVRNTLYMIRGTAIPTRKPTMITTTSDAEPVMLPRMRLISAPPKDNRSRWGMYVFPTQEPIITVQAAVEPVMIRAIRKKRSSKVSLHAFPSLTRPKKAAYSQLRMIRQSLREL